MIRPRTHVPRTRGTGGLADGLRYAAQHQQLWVPLAMMALVGLFSFNFPVILPVFAAQTLPHGQVVESAEPLLLLYCFLDAAFPR